MSPNRRQSRCSRWAYFFPRGGDERPPEIKFTFSARAK